eukprot:TRINITY_DN3700_c0_g1_i2.p1 TRINITY_DN3700_c0_g1~~TRINITY_DN3700_c0_g1_i2.p1  ORF type:complete len:332 (+),score=66.84 TRINITY_DN3700_c0_g1_i2:462-1457(+)
MVRLSTQLQHFIRTKMKTDIAWKGVNVVFSGHEVPGEGEHKIMEFIRHEKAQVATWDPNQTHCLYGLDADLIMLSLVTHEPHFALLREEGVLNRNKAAKKGESQEFHLLHISMVRDYLALEFDPLGEEGLLPFTYDPERCIDDWVLMCFLIGNDFIPNLPGIDIADGSLNEFFSLYRRILPTLDGYLVESGVPNFSRLEVVFQGLAEIEVAHFMIVPEGIEKVNRRVMKENKGNRDADVANVIFGGGLGFSSDSVGSLGSVDPSEETDVASAWKANYYVSKFGKELMKSFICISGPPISRRLSGSVATTSSVSHPGVGFIRTTTHLSSATW